ncbi:MAG: outer membrane beta-barrel protein [Verrucomicrobiota bacterium JB022]|nr:outer membrane beta-barrel protein [Verrucomicrobiota bacterium JB022]
MFKHTVCFAAAAVAFATAGNAAFAQASGPDWRFQIGLSYTSGFSDLVDEFEAEGYEMDWEWPVGVNFLVGQDFANGLGWDATIGPMVFIFGDADAYVIPLGVGGRYTFTPEANIAPYVRAGLSYAFAGGDYLDTGDLGYTGAVGVEFNRDRRMSFGLEASYNSATVEFDHYWENDADVKTHEWQIGAFIAF